MSEVLPRVLTIAGSDSGGGAGIQADLKTFSALGVYGMSAITAVTAQNTVGVRGIHELPVEFVAAQIDAVLEDIGANVVKTGMLASAAIIEAVYERLAHHRPKHIVVDPVMVATSGDRLLREDAVRSYLDRLLPLAELVTPNLLEASILSGRSTDTRSQIEDAAKSIHETGVSWVLIKGGHASGETAVDFLYNGVDFAVYSSPRVRTNATHGTGCTLSAAIAAYLAGGTGMREAVQLAKEFVTKALQESFPLGHGHGPVNHLWRS